MRLGPFDEMESQHVDRMLPQTWPKDWGRFRMRADDKNCPFKTGFHDLTNNDAPHEYEAAPLVDIIRKRYIKRLRFIT